MEEAVSQVGEWMIGMLAAAVAIGVMMLLLSQTEAGSLRDYIVYVLEAAC